MEPYRFGIMLTDLIGSAWRAKHLAFKPRATVLERFPELRHLN
jgi:hypothetical protein